MSFFISKQPSALSGFTLQFLNLHGGTFHLFRCTLKVIIPCFMLTFFHTRRRKDLPKGHWYLQLLSDRPLLPPKTSPLSFPRSPKGCRGGSEEVMSVLGKVACGTRSVYGGVYVPNKYFVLFRRVCCRDVSMYTSFNCVTIESRGYLYFRNLCHIFGKIQRGEGNITSSPPSLDCFGRLVKYQVSQQYC